MHAVPCLGFHSFFSCMNEWLILQPVFILSGGSACVEQDGVLLY